MNRRRRVFSGFGHLCDGGGFRSGIGSSGAEGSRNQIVIGDITRLAVRQPHQTVGKFFAKHRHHLPLPEGCGSIVPHAGNRKAIPGQMIVETRRRRFTGYSYAWNCSVCQALSSKFTQHFPVDLLDLGRQSTDFISLKNRGPGLAAKPAGEAVFRDQAP